MLTPPQKQLTRDAEKRLTAISEADDLGAGFTLATHDMEIRGAGELLGEGQSGQIHSIGFSLYMEMLDRAVKAIKDGKTVDVKQKMRFNLPAAKDEGEITLRLCDAKGKTVARSGLTLVDVLRVSPVTKDFQLFGRDMRTFANAKLAFTWEPNA